MLVLSRGFSERVRIEIGGIFVWVTVVRVGRDKARLGFEGPPEAKFIREELIPAEGAIRVKHLKGPDDSQVSREPAVVLAPVASACASADY